ncbi:MAG TPA: hypothetical protein VH165_06320 [Kofleriaceae bacterium]|nr:hypothetical protein [Kofleriaceae bacterium]
MRCVAAAGLLTLAGCNQILGIAQTTAYDAGPDVISDRTFITLDWQVATVDAATGAPNPQPTFTPIVPAPKLRLAPLHDPADPSALGAFTDADYGTPDPKNSTVIVNGQTTIPRDYVAQPWRLEYTLADGIPHEVQWRPQDKVGHIAVPIFGRLDRDQPPQGAGYTITPSGAPANYMFPRVFTTGVWSAGKVPTPLPAGATIDYDFSNSVSLSGPKANPDATKGEQALVVDFSTGGTSGCRIGVGSAPFAPALQMGAHSAVAPAWDTSQAAVTADVVSGKLVTRLTTTLGNLEAGFTAGSSFVQFGSAASINMPGLAGNQAAMQIDSAVLPVPVMATLLQCPYNTVPLPMTAQPKILDPFPKILHVQLVDSRMAIGATLASGMETVLTSSGGGFMMAFPAPVPQAITLTTPTKGTIPLDGTSEQVDVGPASGTFTLAFTPEVAAELRGDYYDVILHKIVSGNLTVERIYTVPTPADNSSPSVLIDGTLLQPGADYVFEIRAYKGHPHAVTGDFAPVDYPYGAAIVFPRTFKAS